MEKSKIYKLWKVDQRDPILQLEIEKDDKRNLWITLWCDVPERWMKAILSDSNGIQTHNHLVRSRILNHLAKPAKWLSCVVSTYLNCAFVCMLLSIHVRASILQYNAIITMWLLSFPDITKLKIVWIKITIFFKRHLSIIIWSFSG